MADFFRRSAAMHQSNQAHIVPSRGSHPMDSFSSQMTAPMSLNSYDYFETGDGWIYITVCLFQDDGIVLGKTAYSPTGKKSLRGIIDDSEHPTYPTCSFGGIATYLIPIKEVIKIYNPSEFDHVIESIGLLRKIRYYANIS